MTFTPFISVIVTTHDRPSLLQRALTSLLSQNFLDFEIVLCSDTGESETKLVAAQHLRNQDVFLCIPGIRGPAESRNLGIKLSRGKWVCFLDDDDSFEPDYFNNISQFLSDNNNLYHCNYFEVIESRLENKCSQIDLISRSNPNIHQDNILIGNYIPNNTIFVSSNIAKNTFFDPHFESHEDWDWLISLRCKYKLNFIHIPIWGPKVHLSQSGSRNNGKNRDTVHTLDFLSIYRKWPSTQEVIKEARSKELNRRGLNLSSEYL
jgi:glycosyltransferase involved in cell wall biosynthesis